MFISLDSQHKCSSWWWPWFPWSEFNISHNTATDVPHYMVFPLLLSPILHLSFIFHSNTSLTLWCVCVFMFVCLISEVVVFNKPVLGFLNCALLSSLRHCAALSLSLLPSDNMSSLLHHSDGTLRLMRTDSSACVSLTFLISALLSCSPAAISLRKAMNGSTFFALCEHVCVWAAVFYETSVSSAAHKPRSLCRRAAQLKGFLLRSSGSIAVVIVSPLELEMLNEWREKRMREDSREG